MLSILITLFMKRELVALVFFGLWLVYCHGLFLFLLVALVGCVLLLLLFLDIFYSIFQRS